ncbi:Eco29kI family restriction endonuclease [Aurantimonas sp. HBX-1]|uniref:Eco29kI family restriction endonuclease n=1 Tax=Aurantimonas sp. HBX-1 TaxID=2906072 RepID=UPI001F1652FA|nr:Eco29kI family restriction endonuclease [Aurantimonas sp. HBX-1]UIJ72214.1 Eco29kI family restriction endonuclease [Aurantimonas sp. HBX-1]
MTRKKLEAAYNPLARINLAKSIEGELLNRPTKPLSDADQITGAGMYVIYYTGDFEPYEPIATANAGGQFARPIYVGKAIPKGGRKGGLSENAAAGGAALADRLRQHASSVSEARNLKLTDFYFRHLVVDDIWIPLGENMLIESFKPVWNRAIDGFGNKDPGRRRATQFKSPWDVLHPGRSFSTKLADSPVSPDFLVKRVADYFANRPLAKLPKVLAKQLAAEQAEDEEGSDEV